MRPREEERKSGRKIGRKHDRQTYKQIDIVKYIYCYFRLGQHRARSLKINMCSQNNLDSTQKSVAIGLL